VLLGSIATGKYVDTLIDVFENTRTTLIARNGQTGDLGREHIGLTMLLRSLRTAAARRSRSATPPRSGSTGTRCWSPHPDGAKLAQNAAAGDETGDDYAGDGGA